MKLIVAIIHPDDIVCVIKYLTRGGFSSTKLTTMGIFQKEKNVTILVGVEEARLDKALEIINKFSHNRTRMIPTMSLDGMESPMTEINVGGANVFVLDCEQFMRF